jgi:hypothetical protein
MLNNYSDLLPFRQYSEYDVVNMYSLDTTGVGGRFVTFLTGNNSPDLSAGQFSAATPGASYAGVTALRYENSRKVKLSASGDSVGQILGLSLYGTVEYDNNGQKVLFHPEIQKENAIVVSGQTIPVATAGIFRIRSNAYTNTPFPGYVGVISDAGLGKLAFVPPTTLVYESGLAVCKVLSTSGSLLGTAGGYADIKLTLG